MCVIYICKLLVSKLLILYIYTLSYIHAVSYIPYEHRTSVCAVIYIFNANSRFGGILPHGPIWVIFLHNILGWSGYINLHADCLNWICIQLYIPIADSDPTATKTWCMYDMILGGANPYTDFKILNRHTTLHTLCTFWSYNHSTRLVLHASVSYRSIRIRILISL